MIILMGWLVVDNLKVRQLFSDQMNRNRLDLILARRYYNCSTIENLRCLNSAANEIIRVWSRKKASFKRSINPVQPVINTEFIYRFHANVEYRPRLLS